MAHSPKSILDPRKWPPLRARFIISVTMSLLPQLPAELYRRVCLHASDAAVASAVVARKVEWAGLSDAEKQESARAAEQAQKTAAAAAAPAGAGANGATRASPTSH